MRKQGIVALAAICFSISPAWAGCFGQNNATLGQSELCDTPLMLVPLPGDSLPASPPSGPESIQIEMSNGATFNSNPNEGKRFDYAPGFDCGTASTPAEFSVCQSPKLAALDQLLNALYQLERSQLSGGSRAHLRDIQRAWLVLREACGGDVGCLSQRYDQQINFLRNFHG